MKNLLVTLCVTLSLTGCFQGTSGVGVKGSVEGQAGPLTSSILGGTELKYTPPQIQQKVQKRTIPVHHVTCTGGRTCYTWTQ